MSNVSSEEAGLFNYVVKRDFRRLMDSEKRREGYDYFWPNTVDNFATDPGDQPFPNDVTERPLSTDLVATITRTGTTATMTFPSGHIFVEGETVKVYGANQSAYNGTFEISNVTRTTFDYEVVGAPATPATGTLLAKSAMPINLVHLARRPNGKTAVIVGTAPRIFRFYALENGQYVSTDPDDYPVGQIPEYWSTDPLDYPVGQIPEYVQVNVGDWIIIGNGYQINAQRWEAVSINGWSVFNNGVDLPFTYRVEHFDVEPIYELREQGVAAVGTIADLAGILLVADISEIFEDKITELFDLVGLRRSGDILGSQTTTVVTTAEKFFAADSSDLGMWIVFDDGSTTQILAPYISETQANVSTSATVTQQRFTLRPKLSQNGNMLSTPVTGSITTATDLVNSSAPYFNLGMVGKDLRFTNGWSGQIIAFNGVSQVQLDRVAPATFSTLPFYISDGSGSGYADYLMNSSAPIFTNDMVGRNIILESGIVRRIDAYVSPTQVRVDSDMPIASQYGGPERTDTYGAYIHPEFINRVQYKVAWSLEDYPRRWGALLQATAVAGSNLIHLLYPVKSFEIGQEILVVGAGAGGGNLLATINYLAGGWVITMNTPAITSTTEAHVEQADVLDSILGSEELQDDSSGIIRMMELQGTLVIYKDTSIFLGSFTGDVDTPFVFKLRKVPNGKTLYYRYTLAAINTAFHVYAGQNAFYKFDLTNQIPQEIELSKYCQDIFFSQATLANTNEIFAADNALTKEIFIVFPSETVEKLLAFDYQFSTFATSTMLITAGDTVKRPETGISIGETDNWFVMGNAEGTVLLYGLADEVVDAWGTKEITYRRSANPFTATKSSYDSVLKPGLSNFTDPYNDKMVRSYVPILSSRSPNGSITIKFYSARNTAEAPTLLATYVMASPASQNLVPMHFMDCYFQEEITISGQNNPLQLFQRIWDVGPVMSTSHERRP